MSEFLIDRQQELNGVVEEVSDRVGIDTEFYIRRTFFRIPCLLQIATQHNSYIVDLTAPLNLKPIETVIQDCGVEKVMHSASEDLKVLHYLFGEIPSNLVDTQLAHAFVSLEDQRSYHGVVKQYLNVELNQSSSITTSNWRNRPLSKNQLEYAIDDVQYLLPLRTKLMEELRSLGRVDWFKEEMRLYLDSQSANWKFDFSNVQGFRKLSEYEQSLVMMLSEWRESQAKRTNVPRRWIATDEQLVWSAQHRKETIAQFRKELGAKIGGRLHKVMRKVLRNIQSNGPKAPHPSIESSQFHKRSPVINKMKEIVRSKSELLEMSRNLLGTQGNLISWANSFVDTQRFPSNFGRWRENLLGTEFREVLGQLR
ncbi:MAG: hypothetical protein OXG24_08275 [Gammaproteobacteria bacterium]|nr:hypothetical protein [Gammaproteobacteria bacterium]